MQNNDHLVSSVVHGKFGSILAAAVLLSLSLLTPLATSPALADSQFSEKAIAQIFSCDSISRGGFATLKEYDSEEGVKEIDVYMQVDGLSSGKHAVHIHQTASCIPCGSAGGHFDPGNFGMTNPDANHPFHSGDLINIESNGNSGLMTTMTSRVTLSDGPLSLFDTDGSAFIIHTNPDSYCSGGDVAGCAGGSRAACGIISKVETQDNFELMVSPYSDRYNPVELANAEIMSNAYIFLTPTFPSQSVRSVSFYLNGNFFKTEGYAPYDFTGTYSNNNSGPYYTNNLPNGTHSIAAKIVFLSGETTYVSSEFVVDNNSYSFGNGSENQ